MAHSLPRGHLPRLGRRVPGPTRRAPGPTRRLPGPCLPPARVRPPRRLCPPRGPPAACTERRGGMAGGRPWFYTRQGI